MRRASLRAEDGQTEDGMITDARAANQRPLPPPRVDFLAAEGPSRIEVTVDGDPCLLRGSSWGIPRALRVCSGVGDVENCFHRMAMPPWLSPLFSFPAASVDELRVDGVETVEGLVQGGSTTVCLPILSSLAHGLFMLFVFLPERQRQFGQAARPAERGQPGH